MSPGYSCRFSLELSLPPSPALLIDSRLPVRVSSNSQLGVFHRYSRPKHSIVSSPTKDQKCVISWGELAEVRSSMSSSSPVRIPLPQLFTSEERLLPWARTALSFD